MPSSTHPIPARALAQLTATDVSVSRGAVRVLDHVDLAITPRSRLAIVGENGRGKSTLLHVLAGILIPEEGAVRRVGTLGLAEQEMPAGDDRTVGQAVADAIAAPLAALAAVDEAAGDLAACVEGADERYASALEQA